MTIPYWPKLRWCSIDASGVVLCATVTAARNGQPGVFSFSSFFFKGVLLLTNHIRNADVSAVFFYFSHLLYRLFSPVSLVNDWFLDVNVNVKACFIERAVCRLRTLGYKGPTLQYTLIKVHPHTHTLVHISSHFIRLMLQCRSLAYLWPEYSKVSCWSVVRTLIKSGTRVRIRSN